MVKFGIYVIKDKYFEDFPDKYLKTNKDENRPCCCAIKTDNGLYWCIPMSTQYEKYEKIINNKLAKNKKCDILHIEVLFGEKSVFLIQDMFPIIDEYIDHEYTKNGEAVILKDERMKRKISSKASTTLALIRKGIKFMSTQPDVLSIEKDLLNRIKADL